MISEVHTHTKHKFPYKWNIKDGYPAKGIDYHGLKVFSCFSCGGGSSMGYKLAGYEVIGCNEIDPRMMACYIKNHYPKYTYLEPIQEFKQRKDLPKELYNLDVLDGSPPCSSFSMAGSREDDWGKEKKFREGQANQVLDTLFFDFIDVAKELQPKVVVAENVKGLLLGEAKKYVIEIYKQFDTAGYVVQHFLLDASRMGVPQARERVFFIALRKDLCNPFMVQKDMFTHVPLLDLNYNEPNIPFKYIDSDSETADFNFSPFLHRHYDEWEQGEQYSDVNNGSGFNYTKAHPEKVIGSILAHPDSGTYHYKYKRQLNFIEYSLAGTYPLDYTHLDNAKYLIGMSVPPVMMAQIAHDIYKQWLSKI